MDNAKVKFKFVTPCISSGADKRSAELRVPSIRGQLIWWTRALGYDENTVSGIFGSANGERTVSSSIIVRNTTKHELKTAVRSAQEIIGTQYDYFLWPIRRQQDARGIILENQEAEITISFRYNRDALEFPDHVLKAFLLLGSIGTRSRRCYGSIYPVSVLIDSRHWIYPQNMNDFRTELSTLLDQYSNCRILQLSDAQNTWQDAVRKCSNFLKKFRCGKDDQRFDQRASTWGRNDHDAGFDQTDRIYRPDIGLPLQTRYYTVEAPNMDRLASPVHFKIIQLENDFYPIVIFFRNHSLSNFTENVTIRTNRGQTRRLSVEGDMLDAMMRPDENYWRGASLIGDFQ